MNEKQYRNAEGITQSQLKYILESPKSFQINLLADRKPTTSMMIGTAIHTMLFEPRNWQQTLAIWEGDRRAGKAWQEFQAENGYKIILKSNEYQKVLDCVDEVKQFPFFQKLKDEKLYIEQPIFWNDTMSPAPHLKLKSKPDVVTHTKVIDLKTTSSIAEFERSIWKYKLHFQAAAYLRAVNSFYGKTGSLQGREYYLLAVETSDANLVRCYKLPPIAIDHGSMLWDRALALYAECEQKNKWHGYEEEEPKEVSVPSWMINELDAHLI
tara:strand:+ start:70 stop:873 length:804 start_codon:yes stop_codon:yes gene_type:complete